MVKSLSWYRKDKKYKKKVIPSSRKSRCDEFDTCVCSDGAENVIRVTNYGDYRSLSNSVKNKTECKERKPNPNQCICDPSSHEENFIQCINYDECLCHDSSKSSKRINRNYVQCTPKHFKKKGRFSKNFKEKTLKCDEVTTKLNSSSNAQKQCNIVNHKDSLNCSKSTALKQRKIKLKLNQSRHTSNCECNKTKKTTVKLTYDQCSGFPDNNDENCTCLDYLKNTKKDKRNYNGNKHPLLIFKNKNGKSKTRELISKVKFKFKSTKQVGETCQNNKSVVPYACSELKHYKQVNRENDGVNTVSSSSHSLHTTEDICDKVICARESQKPQDNIFKKIIQKWRNILKTKPTLKPEREPKPQEPNKKPPNQPEAKPSNESKEKLPKNPKDKPLKKPKEKSFKEPKVKAPKKPKDKPLKEPMNKPPKELKVKKPKKPKDEPVKKTKEKTLKERKEKPPKERKEKPQKKPKEKPPKERKEKPPKKPKVIPPKEPKVKPAKEPKEKPLKEPKEKPPKKPKDKPAKESKVKAPKRPKGKSPKEPKEKSPKKPKEKPPKKQKVEPLKEPKEKPLKESKEKPPKMPKEIPLKQSKEKLPKEPKVKTPKESTEIMRMKPKERPLKELKPKLPKGSNEKSPNERIEKSPKKPKAKLIKEPQQKLPKKPQEKQPKRTDTTIKSPSKTKSEPPYETRVIKLCKCNSKNAHKARCTSCTRVLVKTVPAKKSHSQPAYKRTKKGQAHRSHTPCPSVCRRTKSSPAQRSPAQRSPAQPRANHRRTKTDAAQKSQCPWICKGPTLDPPRKSQVRQVGRRTKTDTAQKSQCPAMCRRPTIDPAQRTQVQPVGRRTTTTPNQKLQCPFVCRRPTKVSESSSEDKPKTDSVKPVKKSSKPPPTMKRKIKLKNESRVPMCTPRPKPICYPVPKPSKTKKIKKSKIKKSKIKKSKAYSSSSGSSTTSESDRDEELKRRLEKILQEMIDEKYKQNNNNRLFAASPPQQTPPPPFCSLNSAPTPLLFGNKFKSFSQFCSRNNNVLSAPPKISLPPLSFPCQPFDYQMTALSTGEQVANGLDGCCKPPTYPEVPNLPFKVLDAFKSPWKILSLCLVCSGVACICIPCLFCLKSMFFSCN